VFDFGSDGEIASLLEALVGKVEVVKPQEIPFHLLSQKLQPTQYIVVLSGLAHPQPPEVFQALFTFLGEGGRIFSYNCAMHIMGSLFPSKIHPSPPSTTIKAKLKIVNDKELFSAYPSEVDINLEYTRYPVEIVDKQNVTILAKIQGQTQEPLLIKFSQGPGLVYILVSKLFTMQTLLKTPKQKDISPTELVEYLTQKGASKTTIMAWECALRVGYFNAFLIAVTALPSMEMIARLLIREKVILNQLPEVESKPPVQQLQVQPPTQPTQPSVPQTEETQPEPME